MGAGARAGASTASAQPAARSNAGRPSKTKHLLYLEKVRHLQDGEVLPGMSAEHTEALRKEAKSLRPITSMFKKLKADSLPVVSEPRQPVPETEASVNQSTGPAPAPAVATRKARSAAKHALRTRSALEAHADAAAAPVPSASAPAAADR
jgi:hypothetical protein